MNLTITEPNNSCRDCHSRLGQLVGLLQHGAAILLVGFVAIKNASITAFQHQQGLVLFRY
jgi:hypothetical protein